MLRVGLLLSFILISHGDFDVGSRFKEDPKFRFDYEFNQLADGWLKLHEIPSTWREARMRCHAEGAVLASPLTHELKTVISRHIQYNTRLLNNRAIFTGIHATFSKGDYTSIEGVPLNRIRITWAPGEPDNFENAENCLAMNNDGDLLNVRCGDVLPYICYKKYRPLTMTSCGTTDKEYTFEPRTSSCYKFHRRGLVWSQAFMTCQAEGGYLVIINSDEEAKVVQEIMKKNPASTIRSTDPNICAVGFHDWGETFMTIHGETLEAAGYEHWGKGEPNNIINSRTGDAGEFCGSVFRDGTLNDQGCNVPIAFLCEKDPQSLQGYYETRAIY